MAFKVLVVQPEPVTRLMLREALESEGFDVECASTEDAAHQFLDAGTSFDALVLDTNITSGPLGCKVALYARRLYPALRVLLISNMDHRTAAELGLSDAALLSKPFDLELLLLVLREVAADQR